MFPGIAGPVLILYTRPSSGFAQRPVAFYSSADRRGSGIIGALHLTPRIQHGLYGRQATLRERQGAPRSGGRVAEIEISFRAARRATPQGSRAYANGSEASRACSGCGVFLSARGAHALRVLEKHARSRGGLLSRAGRGAELARAESGLTRIRVARES